jgi:hypothetical protein
MEDSLLACVREELALRLERGAELGDVQGELIDAAPGLSEDERAALWLFAWSYRPRGGRDAGHMSGPIVG